MLKQYRQTVARINALEAQIAALSDDELRANPAEFKQRVQQGESLDAILPEAFAVVREGSKRALQMRHFDVQLIVAWPCITARLPKCAPVKAKR